MEYLQSFELFENTYDLPLKEDLTRKKSELLLKATVLFAKNGYAQTTVRQLADSVETTPGAIYNHYSCKDELWKSVLSQADVIYRLYMDELGKEVLRADSLEDAVEIILSYHRRPENDILHYVFSLVQKEKQNDSECANIFTDLFFNETVSRFDEWFKELIKNGKASHFDTKPAAVSLCMGILYSVSFRAMQNQDFEVSMRQSDMLNMVADTVMSYSRRF